MPEKLKNIEFLRFVFILSIISVHIRKPLKMFFDSIPYYQTLYDNFCYAAKAVDYFFIIAGFFLFLKTDFSQKFLDFAKNKLIRLMPVVIFSIFLFWIVSLFTTITFPKFEYIFTLLALNGVGLTLKNSINVATWFVSALFWTMCFYFYLYKIIDKKWFNLVCACIVFFCYSMSVHTSGEVYSNIAYVFNRGLLSAFAGIGVGYFISLIYKDNIETIKNWTLNIWQKLCFTIAEGYFLGWLVWYTFLHKMKCDNYLILILGFIVVFILFLMKKGWVSQVLNNNFSVFLGQFTFSIFLTHTLFTKLWRIYLCQANPQWVIANPILNLVIIYAVSIMFGVLTYYLYEKPVTKYLKNKFCAKI